MYAGTALNDKSNLKIRTCDLSLSEHRRPLNPKVVEPCLQDINFHAPCKYYHPQWERSSSTKSWGVSTRGCSKPNKNIVQERYTLIYLHVYLTAMKGSKKSFHEKMILIPIWKGVDGTCPPIWLQRKCEMMSDTFKKMRPILAQWSQSFILAYFIIISFHQDYYHGHLLR